MKGGAPLTEHDRIAAAITKITEICEFYQVEFAYNIRDTQGLSEGDTTHIQLQCIDNKSTLN